MTKHSRPDHHEDLRVLFISLGCDKNLVDSEFMLGKLSHSNFIITDDEADADVIIINTCCFILDAKEESIQTILDMADHRINGRCRALIVCGCLAERYRDEILREIPEVDAVLGTNSTEDIIEAIEKALAGINYESYRPLTGIEEHSEKRVVSTGGHYAYLKIAEGCSRHCTYCIIPSVRGEFRSVPMEELIRQAEKMSRDGVKELILVAQDTTMYGTDLYGRKSLHLLVNALSKITGICWIRLMYCYPEEIYDELIDSMISNDNVCHYIDMPIQHINSDILKRMGRRTSEEAIRSKISLLRNAVPDICIRTSIICGFPGETSEQHEQLMKFINETEFDRLGAFTYSREENTPAASFDGQIDEAVKRSRRDEVMELQEEIILDMNEAMTGKRMQVMIEGEIPDENVYVGRTYRDAPDVDGYIFINSDEPLRSGDIIEAVVTGAYEYDLIGESV